MPWIGIPPTSPSGATNRGQIAEGSVARLQECLAGGSYRPAHLRHGRAGTWAHVGIPVKSPLAGVPG
jgi:hypothetical protein